MNTPAPGISTAEMLTKLRFRASWPLDVGHIATIPASIRNAVILRDKHCRFPGGCFL